MKTITIQIEGMSCQHCVASVTSAVSELDGVSNVTVSLENKNMTADIDESKVNEQQIAAVIEEIGFDVVK